MISLDLASKIESFLCESHNVEFFPEIVIDQQRYSFLTFLSNSRSELQRRDISLADDLLLEQLADQEWERRGGGREGGLMNKAGSGGGSGYISIEPEVLSSFLIDCLSSTIFSQNSLPSHILHITSERVCAWFSVSSFLHLGHGSIETALVSLCDIDMNDEQTSIHDALRQSQSVLPLSLGCIATSNSDQVNPRVYRSPSGSGDDNEGRAITDPDTVSKAVHAIVTAPLLCSDLSLSLCWRERFYTSLGPLSSFISRELYSIRKELTKVGRMLIQTAPLRFSLFLSPLRGIEEQRLFDSQPDTCTRPAHIQHSARQCAAFLGGIYAQNRGFDKVSVDSIHSHLKDYFSLLAEDVFIASFTLSLAASLSFLPADVVRGVMESVIFPAVSIVTKDIPSTFLSFVLSSDSVSQEHISTMYRLSCICNIPLWNDVVQQVHKKSSGSDSFLNGGKRLDQQLSQSTFSDEMTAGGEGENEYPQAPSLSSSEVETSQQNGSFNHHDSDDTHEETGESLSTSSTSSSSSPFPSTSSRKPGSSSRHATVTTVSKEEAERVIQSIREAHGMDLDESQMDENTLKMRQNNHNTIGNALEKLSTELYSKDTHFVLELIQNADDNEYEKGVVPTLSFSILSDRIVLRNNEIGFSSRNVQAICDVARSTKSKHSLGFIGAKGIGFKSVYCVTETPHICSGHYRFKFDRKSHSLGYILPHTVSDLDMVSALSLSPTLSSSSSSLVDMSEKEQEMAVKLLDKESETWRTMMSLPFSDKKMTLLLDQVNPFLLLFLHRLQRIDLNDSNSGKFVTMRKKRIGGNIVEVMHTERQIDSSSSLSLSVPSSPSHNEYSTNKTHTMWCMIESGRIECGSILRSGEKVERTEVTVGFPLPRSSILSQIVLDHKTDLLPTREVFAFLPVRSYGFKFIVQGDFVVPSSRESVSDCEWNERLKAEVPKLFCEGVKQFIKPSDSLLLYVFKSLPDSYVEEEVEEKEEEEEKEREEKDGEVEDEEKTKGESDCEDSLSEFDEEDEEAVKEREEERKEREIERKYLEEVKQMERIRMREKLVEKASPALCQLFLEYVPSLSHTNDFFASSASDIHNRLKKTRIILSRSLSWNLPGEVIQVPPHLHEAVVSLLPCQSEQSLFNREFIHPDVHLSPSLSHALGIDSFNADHVIEMAKEVISMSLHHLNMRLREEQEVVSTLPSKKEDEKEEDEIREMNEEKVENKEKKEKEKERKEEEEEEGERKEVKKQKPKTKKERRREAKEEKARKKKKKLKQKEKEKEEKKEEEKEKQTEHPPLSHKTQHMSFHVEDFIVHSFPSSPSPSSGPSVPSSSTSLSLEEKKQRGFDWITKWFLLLSRFWRHTSGGGSESRSARQSQIPKAMIERVRQLRLIPLRSGEVVSVNQMRAPIFLCSHKEGMMSEREKRALALLTDDIHVVSEEWLERVERESQEKHKAILQVLSLLDIRPLSLSDIASRHILSYYLSLKKGDNDCLRWNHYFSFLFLTSHLWEKEKDTADKLRKYLIVPTVCI